MPQPQCVKRARFIPIIRTQTFRPALNDLLFLFLYFLRGKIESINQLQQKEVKKYNTRTVRPMMKAGPNQSLSTHWTRPRAEVHVRVSVTSAPQKGKQRALNKTNHLAGNGRHLRIFLKNYPKRGLLQKKPGNWWNSRPNPLIYLRRKWVEANYSNRS